MVEMGDPRSAHSDSRAHRRAVAGEVADVSGGHAEIEAHGTIDLVVKDPSGDDLYFHVGGKVVALGQERPPTEWWDAWNQLRMEPGPEETISLTFETKGMKKVTTREIVTEPDYKEVAQRCYDSLFADVEGEKWPSFEDWCQAVVDAPRGLVQDAAQRRDGDEVAKDPSTDDSGGPSAAGIGER